MDKWLTKKPTTTIEIDEAEPSATSSKQSKQRSVMRKYYSGYLKIGFSWNGDEEDPRPQCVVSCEVFANESVRPEKLRRHIETKHSDLKNQPFEFFERKLSELKTTKRRLLHFTKINEKAMQAWYLISL
jgi:hypothetical protein